MFTPAGIIVDSSPEKGELLVTGLDDGIPRNVTLQDAQNLHDQIRATPEFIPNPVYIALRDQAFAKAIEAAAVAKTIEAEALPEVITSVE